MRQPKTSSTRHFLAWFYFLAFKKQTFVTDQRPLVAQSHTATATTAKEAEDVAALLQSLPCCYMTVKYGILKMVFVY